ncbi:cell division transport system permease protein [Stackebrandtia albiflava]|uniref:Cell division protein FtsX n=1 Tax=Stackebrandtia albiflava TaxID=406432 RepID=A0A562V4T6_9ACTN|nr:permease-like cell division protein FtsX [Stackebrandtia albiflava]TWJ12855.1 cell division transport system permease protein [Stackebrandtia albiflava]
MRAKYVLSEVAVGLWRNISMTIAMIITMAVSLTMLGAGLLMYFQVQSMEAYYRGQVEIIVYLNHEITEEDEVKGQLEESLIGDPMVKTVEFKTKEEAWTDFQELFADAPDLVESVDKDRLPASFEVSLNNMDDADEFIAKYEGFGDGAVERIMNQRDALEEVFGLMGGVQRLSLILALVQGIAALLLVANTIQVAAYSKRREVSIMKLVGASNWFVQAPFVLEAVFAGLIGAILAFLALVAGKAFLVDGTFKALFDIMTEMSWTRIWLMLPILAGIASVISAITGWVTLRFQVKV